MNFLKVNGVDWSKISTYEVERNKLSKAQRNSKQDLKKQKINTKYKIYITFNLLYQEEYEDIWIQTDEEILTVEYYNPKVRGIVTGKFYAPDTMKIPIFVIKDGLITKQWSINLIEY